MVTRCTGKLQIGNNRGWYFTPSSVYLVGTVLLSAYNIDIYLGDIDYIEIPCILHNLQIKDAIDEDCIYLSEKLGKDISPNKVIVLISEGKKFYIVASIVKVMENDLDYGVLPIYAFLANKELL